ncbi:hypothetical protein M2322_000855 [Rhodoblastus acidophilus]|uniref:hypothetical protein n=1 Tax=Rhodoblastus acidophilus TaxID=1074 RepID=UPI0022242EF2|nr:hypothetical protein [Rhodoblastus acidophilus]MCW2315321.1 hypothetical protein [Rhodoblastus acidophilus]
MVDGVNIGQFHDGSAGIRVSVPGYDGDPPTGTVDPSHLQFSTGWSSSLPIWWVSDNIAFSAGSTVTINFPGTLPYTPFISTMITSEGITHSTSYTDWSGVGGYYAQALTIETFPDRVTLTVGSGWKSAAPGGAGTATNGTIKIVVYRIGMF